MTRAKQRYDEYFEYYTEEMKHCDQEWKINCLETAQTYNVQMCILQNSKKKKYSTPTT